MRVDDISIQVRDKNLARVGTITPEYLDFQGHPRFNDPGDWTIRLPKSHPMVSHLATPGSGIIVSLYGQEYFSGFTTKPEEVTNSENPDGTYTFKGKDDTALLFYALAFPQPSNSNPATQTVAYDTRSGNPESVMRGFVGANLVSGTAPAGRLGGLRSFIRLEAVNGNKGGASRSKSARFDNLGKLLQELATLGGLGFRLIQRGSILQFEVYEPSDVSALVRFDVESGTLRSTSLQMSAPNVTRAIAGGRGEGTEREIIQRTTADSVAAESEWGLIIEEFISYTNAESTTELQQTADERLIEDGFTATAVKAIPSDDQTMKFVTDWDLGDTVGLVAYGQPTKARVSEAVIIANSQRVAVGAGIGDISGFDPSKAMEKRVEDTQRKVSQLERTLELGGSVTWDSVTGKPLAYPTMPIDYATYIPSAPYSTYPMGSSITFVDPDIGWPHPSYYGTLITNRSYSGGGGTIQYWSSYQSGETRIFYRTWFYQATDWSPWKALATEDMVNAAVASAVPTGTITQTARSTAPAGWLLCQGQAVSRTTYAGLFAAIGTAYGAGDGSTTFNLPDLRGRVPVGLDSTQTEFDALNEAGGAKTHTLSLAEMPAHDHSGTTATDTSSATWTAHGAGAGTIISGGSGRASLGTARSNYRSGGSNISGATSYDSFTVNMTHNHSFTTSVRGAGDPHNNLQPYRVVNYQIKT